MADFNCVDPYPQLRMCVPGEYMCLEIKNQTEKVDDTLTNNLSHNRNHLLKGVSFGSFFEGTGHHPGKARTQEHEVAGYVTTTVRKQ